MQENFIPNITEEPFIPNLVENEKWVGLFGYRAQDQRIVLSKGQMYSLIVIDGPQGFPTQLAGKYVWEAMVDKYYFNSTGTPMACLKEAMKAGKSRLVSVLKSDKVFKEEGVDISIINLVVWSDYIYFGIIGSPLFYLLRDNRVIDVAGAFNDPHAKTIINVGSGKLEANDFIVMASPKLIDRFDDYLDDVHQANHTFSLANLKTWFKRESALFDADEGMYLLGVDLDETHLGKEEVVVDEFVVDQGAVATADSEDTDSEKDSDKKAGGLSAAVVTGAIGQFAGNAGRKIVGFKDMLLPKVKGLFDNVKGKITGKPSEKAIEVKTEAEVPLFNPAQPDQESSDLIIEEEDLKEYTDSAETPERDFSEKHIPVENDIDVTHDDSEVSYIGEENSTIPRTQSDIETTHDLHLEQTQQPQIPREQQIEEIKIMGVPLTHEMINKMSFHEKVMYKNQIDAFEARETALKNTVSQESFGNDGGNASTDVPQNRETTFTPKSDNKVVATLQKVGKKLGDIAKDLGRKLLAAISSIKFLSGTKKYFVGKKPESFAKYLLIGVVVLILLGVLISRVVEARRISGLRDEYTTQISKVDSDIKSAKEVIDVDPATARTTLVAALASAKEAKKIEYSENASEKRISEIGTLIDQIEKTVRISEANKNFAIALDAFVKFGDKANVTDFTMFGDILYLADPTTSSVYTYNVTTKATGKIADTEDVLQQPTNIEVGTGGVVYIYDKGQGMIKYSPESGELKVLSGLTPRILGTIDEFGVYGKKDNLYFLSSAESKVYRSTDEGSGYAAPDKEYIDFDGLTQGSDVAIDGNVFVASRDAEQVYKFFSGKSDRFDITGLYEPLGTTEAIYIKQGLKDLYLVDTDFGRIVILETPDNDRHKGQGVLVKQYVYDGKRKEVFLNAQEIIISEDKTIAYILENNKIYSVVLGL